MSIEAKTNADLFERAQRVIPGGVNRLIVGPGLVPSSGLVVHGLGRSASLAVATRCAST